ncbi:MAG: DUF4238 domain-containing protein [Candidatus Brevundimonas phytovorans]|nr:DUF4238 domain-containing protein [Brevundimonas sp.]WEK58810.1 MAG: DUF4238 domain-containing protein [Brevundimonas sp.]
MSQATSGSPKNEKKRHHFIPITYLEGFTDDRGRIQVYFADKGGEPQPIVPTEIAFRKYYYSQPTPDGGKNNNLLEDLFCSEVEQFWPAAREAARTNSITPESWSHLHVMVASLRARVPATRELIESALAAQVRGIAAKMDREGRLPPMPDGLDDIWSKIDVSIDPHQSIHAMPSILQSTNAVVMNLGFEILHNRTSTPFITSDNPVCFYDPRLPDSQRLPYNLDRKPERAELQFPIDSWTMLRGKTTLKGHQGSRGPFSRTITDESVVRRINRCTARYAYRMSFACDRTSETLITRFADRSPVLRSNWLEIEGGDLFWMQTQFGPRPTLPKWKGSKPLESA